MPSTRLTEPEAPSRQAGRRYYAGVSGITLALTLWSFSDNLLWNVGQPSNRDPLRVIHGLFTLGWMLLFFAQAALIRAGHGRLHRRLGLVGVAVAAGTTLSTAWLFVVVWKGWTAMPDYLQANRLLLVVYAALVTLGFRARRRPDHHRRYLLLATLCMMEPVLSRAFDPLAPLLDPLPAAQVDAAWWLFFVITWSGLFLSSWLHDWSCERRIHPATLRGSAAVALAWFVVWLL